MSSPPNLRSVSSASGRERCERTPRKSLRPRRSSIPSLLVLSVVLWSALAAAAPNSRIADEAFHEAAQLYLKQSDEAALEKVGEALSIDPTHEPSQKLKGFIETAMQQKQQQKDKDSDGEQQQQQPSDQGGQDGQKDQQQKSEDGQSQERPTPDQQQSSQQQDTAQGQQGSPTPQQQQASGEPTPSQQQASGEPTPSQQQASAEPTPSQQGGDPSQQQSAQQDAQNAPSEPATPTPGPQVAAAEQPTAAPQATPGSTPGAAAAADARQAQGKDERPMSPEQVQMLLQALNEDELSQLKARPVRIYGETQTDEDW